MTKRNIAWLIAVVGVGVIVWIASGIVWGLVAAVATLLVSEVVERAARRRRRGAREDAPQPLRDAAKRRRNSR